MQKKQSHLRNDKKSWETMADKPKRGEEEEEEEEEEGGGAEG